MLRAEARAAVHDAYRSVVEIARVWQRYEARGDTIPLGYDSLERCLEVQLAAAGAVAGLAVSLGLASPDDHRRALLEMHAAAPDLFPRSEEEPDWRAILERERHPRGTAEDATGP